MSISPPRTGERFLQWCLGKTPSAQSIVGDLRQEFAAIHAERGGLHARVWYWRQVLAIGGRYLGREGVEVGVGGRDTRRPSLAFDLLSGVRSSFRVFRTSPGFAAAVVLTLGLGLGANATMFGAVDRILLSPPEHVEDPDDLRFVYLSGLGARSLNFGLAYSFPDYEAIRDVPALVGAAAYRPRRVLTVGSGPEAGRAVIQDATAEFFTVLGVQPALGRLFGPDDDRAGAVPVAILGYGFWEQEFGADPEVLGRTVVLGDHTYEIVGVMPRGFTGANLETVHAWVPLRMNVPLTSSWGPLESRGAWWFRVVVRLGEGVTDEEASARMTEAHGASVLAAIEAGEDNSDNSNGAQVHVGSFVTALGPNADEDTAITLWLAGVSLLVLLIACANVTNLMLARGLDRKRERAVRLAFGVSRRRLISQALGEALVLAAAGGVAAMIVANWSGRAIYDLLLPGLPAPESFIGWRLLGFLGLVVLMTTVIAGLLPAVQALRTAPGDVLREARRGSSRGGGRARELLTLGQVGLSTILLVGAGLFLESLGNALNVDTGFDQERILTVELEREDDGDPLRRDALYREALAAVESMPGVERAALSSSGRALYGWDEQHDMRASRVDSIPAVLEGGPYTYAGTEGFVETAGLRILRGRSFTSEEYADGGPFALLVSRSFAEGVWPGLDPLEECVFLRRGAVELEGPEPCRPVVGVYEDLIVGSLTDQGRWSVVWPHPIQVATLRSLLIRTQGDPAGLVEPIRERLASLSSEIRFVHVRSMPARIEAMRGPWRIWATLFTAFGVLALVVASLGLYSVLAFAVARRSREIGIRAALGAQRRDMLRMVVSRAVRLVFIGLLVGLGIAAFAGRSMEALLFGVPTLNPMVFGLVAAVLFAAGLIAAWVPAWKATSIDPVRAMAAE